MTLSRTAEATVPSLTTSTRSASHAGLAGGGQMGALIRSIDWSAHPLGPPDSWPQSLRTALSICLGSRFPMALWWGPQLWQFYNDGYIPVLGGKHPRSLGQRGDECWAEIWDVVGPMYRHVVTTGEATFSSDLLLVMERNRYVEETYFTFSYSPIRDEMGDVGGNLITCSETTDRVLGERRLSTLRDLAARVAEGKTAEEACAIAARTLSANPWDMPFALIYLLDPDGRRLRLAGTAGVPESSDVAPSVVDLDVPSGERGWPLERVIGESRPLQIGALASRFGVVPPGPWPQPPVAAVAVPLAAPGQERPAGVLIAGVNPRRELDDSYRGFFDLVAGQIATSVANARAYEEQRQRAEALAEVDRAKTIFFNNVSHEIRTPLALLLGPLEDALADAGSPLPPPQQERVVIAQRNALRLLKLVNTLLDFSRIEAGRMQAAYEPTDVASLTADLASVFRSAIERAGLHLEVDCPPLDAAVYVDRGMWEKIVLNLLSNAFKFTLEGGIAVRMRRAGDRAELTVADTGSGIPEADLPKVFERFHRARTRARSHEGSGIGLALVQELVKLHGGTVGVESEEGRGTTFTVSIPLGHAHLPAEHVSSFRATAPTSLGAAAAPFVEEAQRWLTGEAPEPVREEEEAVVYQTSRGARILLVDDNADMRDYARRLLAGRWTVVAVNDGTAALQAALADPPDLVLTDVMMPGLDGFELLRALRADPRTRTLPVILLSARAGEESRLEGLEAGADDYLVKPFSSRELIARVGAHLAASRVRQEAAREGEELLARERAVRREAELASRAKDQFLAMLSHELRNPMGAISTAAHALQEIGTEDERRLGAIIARQSRHLTSLLDDLLDVARVTAGKIELRRHPVDLADILDRCLRTLEAGGRTGLHNLEVRTEPAWVDGDPSRLEQAITNLLGNAIKYTPAGGDIRVELRRQDGRAVLDIQDNGMGIHPEVLPRIFDLFVQGERTLDRQEGGLGLGLTLVRQIVGMHGGLVEAWSEGGGMGSDFRVILPLDEGSWEPAAEAREERARPAPRRVLIIEDNDDAREALRTLLELDGHQVEALGDGRGGLELARDFMPDLVLLDIGLPGLDGYEVAQALAGHPARSRMRVVAVTGYGQEGDRARAREAGFDAHLVKPVEVDRLRELLASPTGPVPWSSGT